MDPTREKVSTCAHVEPRDIDLVGVTRVELRGYADVVVVRGPEAVHVGAGSAEAACKLTLTRDGDRLRIDQPAGGLVVNEIRGNTHVVMAIGHGARAAGRDLYRNGPRNDLSDGGRWIVALSLPRVEHVRISGAGNIEVVDLQQPTLNLRIDGSGDIGAAGKADEVVVEISGSGDVDSSALQAKRARVELNGSGDARVRASEKVHVELRGSGDVVVYGNPTQRDTRVRGSGDVRFKS
jgi:hypothetical protein